MRPLQSTLAVLATAVLGLSNAAAAATATFHDSYASLAAAATITATKDFNADVPDTSYKGMDILPGVKASTNDEALIVFHSSGMDKSILFALGRHRFLGGEYYQFDFAPGTGYTAVGFNVEAWNPAAPGPARLELGFADGSSVAQTFYKRTGREEDPFYVGFTADQAVVRIRWYEGPEVGGAQNEEVGFNLFSVGVAGSPPGIEIARPVPEPEAYALFLAGLGLTAGATRRRRPA